MQRRQSERFPDNHGKGIFQAINLQICGAARISGVHAEILKQYGMEGKHKASHHRKISKGLERLLTQKGRTLANTRSDQPWLCVAAS